MKAVHPDRALAHPLFWVAVFVLLLNDHVLKQAHLLPGAITGKLSDFAGLLVAPVVLVSLLRPRGRTTRGLAFACVAAGFAAIKLSRPCANAVEAATAYTALPWRIWCDPTDLVALSMLPLAWWLCDRGGESPFGVSLAPCLRAAGLALGVFACAATSYADERYVGTAFLFNGTLRSQTLRLHRLQAPLDCTRPLDDPATWPGRDAFVLHTCPTLDTHEILLLDRAGKYLGRDPPLVLDSFSVEPLDAGMPGPACDAVLLEAEGLRPVVITWNGVPAIYFTGAEFFGNTANDEHGLILERAGERLFIQGTSLLHVLPAGFDPAPADCPNGER